MEAILSDNCYGKSLVRVLKLQRDKQQHDFTEITVEVLLRGSGMEKAYLADDNSRVVPTDTVKQTVYFLAYNNPIDPIEKFGVVVGKHFLSTYSWVTQVDIEIQQGFWARMTPGGKPSDYGFVPALSGKRVARIVATRSAITVSGGVQDFKLLKTTGSGFTGFNKCALTVLPEAKDRMMLTSATVNWRYEKEPSCYNATFNRIKDIIQDKFCDHYSPSLQFTQHRIGQEIMARVPEISEIKLIMPNIHNWTYDLSRFGIKNENVVMQPADEPRGNIQATLVRTRPRL
eukprot:TRINITY_DN14649_c0_g1_i1.p1 TRINITY_DN14649_c0_g1~~TRINITY_DN14649_c0_g1_i1.p1  ORF type:complete len:318 (-),score=52.71 TRINITY_DN14649_c0_g1_i1:26-886(-)